MLELSRRRIFEDGLGDGGWRMDLFVLFLWLVFLVGLVGLVVEVEVGFEVEIEVEARVVGAGEVGYAR